MQLMRPQAAHHEQERAKTEAILGDAQDRLAAEHKYRIRAEERVSLLEQFKEQAQVQAERERQLVEEAKQASQAEQVEKLVSLNDQCDGLKQRCELLQCMVDHARETEQENAALMDRTTREYTVVFTFLTPVVLVGLLIALVG